MKLKGQGENLAMKRIRSAFVILVAFAVFLTGGNLASLAESILTMPASLEVIEQEAFYGSTSIDKIVLPEGIQEIHARAFANSSLKEIHLPDSLSYIDNSAFNGLNNVRISANEGTYAYFWAKSNGYLEEQTQSDEWKNPYATVTSTGSGNADKGTLITEDMIGKILQVKDKVGGWFRMIAPKDGDYKFSVLSDTITDEWFRILPYINGSGVGTLRYEKSTEIQSGVVKNVKKGDVLTWWDCDNTDRWYTFLQPFKLKIDILTSTSGNEDALSFVVVDPLKGTILSADRTSGSAAVNSDAINGTKYTLNVSSNYNWTVSASDTSWLTLGRTSGSSGTVALVMTLKNITDGGNYSTTLTFTVKGTTRKVNITLSKPQVSTTFSVKHGSETIIAQGSSSGSFVCDPTSGKGAIATFTVTSSDSNWTVSASDTSWMTVQKTNSTTAVVTIGSVQDGSNYTGSLNFTAGGKNYTVNMTLNKPGGAAIGTLRFTNSSGSTLTNGSINDHKLDSGNLTVRWQCDNWSYFNVKAILINATPADTDQTPVAVLKDVSIPHRSASISFTKEQLASGAYLKIAVQGVDDSGNKSNNPWISYKLIPTPAAPTNVTAVAQSASSIKVTWTKSASNHITGYDVYYGTSSSSSSAARYNSSPYGASATSATISGLQADTRYYVWVKAKTAAGDSPFSNSDYDWTDSVDEPVTRLAAPKGVTITGTTNEAVSFKFNGVNGASGYYLYYSTSSSFSTSHSKVRADSSELKAYVNGLSSGRTYYFWVAAYDSSGNIGYESSRVSTITGKVSLTVKVNGTTVSNGGTIDWEIGKPLSVVCSNSNGNGKYLVKAFVTTSKPAFTGSDINMLATGVAYNGTGFYYGSKTGNDEFAQSTMSALPFDFNGCSAGQYVKIWIGAEDVNYSTNQVVSGVQFAMKLQNVSTQMDWSCLLTASTVKAGSLVCVKLTADNVKAFSAQIDGTGVKQEGSFADASGVHSRLASICLRVPVGISSGKHTVTVVCSDSNSINDPSAAKVSRKLEFTVGELPFSLRWPFNEDHTVTQHFGARDISSSVPGASTDHKGIDIPANSGTKIYAAAAGTVITSEYSTTAGNWVRIDHGNGVVTEYMHMRDPSGLKVNQRVNAGDFVGYVGSTGNSSGPHLHFGIKVNGKAVDPLCGYIMANSVRAINKYVLKK